MHTPPQFFVDGEQAGPQAVPPRRSPQLELTSLGSTADMRETKKVERLRFSQPARCSISYRETAELDQSRLVRMQRQRELFHPCAKIRQKAPCIILVLKSDDTIVGVAHYDDIPAGVAMSPLLSPQVERVVQITVGKQRRNHRPLWGTGVSRRPLPIVEHSRLQPLANQSDYAWITNPVLYETDQPFMADRVKIGPDVAIQNPVHLRAGNPGSECIQRIVLATPRSEPVREPQQVFFVNRIEHVHHGTLEDFVFQRRDAHRPLRSVLLRNEPSTPLPRPIATAMHASMQIHEVGFQVLLILRPRDIVYAGSCVPL